MSLTFVSVNIERSKHLHRLEPFLKAQQPEVLCLQELYEHDIPFFQNLAGPHIHFVPMTFHPDHQGGTPLPMGAAILSRFPLENPATHYYRGKPPVPTYHSANPINSRKERGNLDSLIYPLVVATVQGMRIATTHMTVTEGGESTEEQRADISRMLTFAKQEAEGAGGLILCGDFNSPRGRASFALIAEQYVDGIPAHYQTSIDPNIHRAGPLQLVVDGLFHTPNYKIENAALHSGVSDHMAISATISKS